MKHLFLARHAKSSWEDSSIADHDRPLNQRGLRDAATQAKAINKHPTRAELVISSSAVRAVGYAEQIAKASAIELQINPDLYTFNLRELAHIVGQLPNNIDRILLVGHNPAIHQLYNQLCNHPLSKFPTAAVAHISINTDDWRNIEYLVGTLQWLCTPKGKIDYHKDGWT